MSTESAEPQGEARARLGGLMRAARQKAGRTTREVVGYSSGHISNVENGRVVPSAELIGIYVEMGGDPRKLHAVFSEVKEESEARKRSLRGKAPVESGASRRITLDSSADEIAKSYRTDRVEHFYQFNELGVIDDFFAVVTVTPLQDGAIYYSFYQDYYADQRSGVLTVEAGMGCEIAKIEQGQGSLILPVLDYSKGIRGDEGSLTFSYKVSVDSDVRTMPLLKWTATRDCSRFSIRVQFSRSCLPKRIRQFRGIRSNEHKFPPQPEHFLPDSANGFYFWDFCGMRNENCGFAWDW
ncbi:helix-turn-helix domain-containing protein [Streptomyces sp. NPDC088785]|uniref:helix-turn-helix domain-containing protein n=1 Tax=Streptomyces sp. NPDC088785 TaxID=3365897 RepID=UPI00381B174D